VRGVRGRVRGVSEGREEYIRLGRIDLSIELSQKGALMS
jgi:hypothetical protein